MWVVYQCRCGVVDIIVVWSHLPEADLIKQRLNKGISTGQIPPFCYDASDENTGDPAIEINPKQQQLKNDKSRV